MSRRTLWAWARFVGPVTVLAVLIWRLGTGPFLNGVRMVDGVGLAEATGIAVLTTVCCAWRWKLVARGLGVDLSLPAAVAAYYRSLFSTSRCPVGSSAMSTAGSATVAIRAMSAVGCGRWHGNAPPARSCN
jgi:hypothetical protein